ncbi:MAG: HopJ type III effector protein [Gammaproteobacteria bacterium]|nr:HopJ type III effector protein [Gammaproteobacteria bacterium]MCW8923009.1 HopJ type III effector protein [Gammaproteobacteria bacterium]
MSQLDKLIKQIKSTPETVGFQNVIETIDNSYNYTPTQFSNGSGDDCVISKAGENEGSCKIFAFGLLHKLNKTQTLNCFGRYYREDVLKYPDNTDHGNIRAFMKHGWKHVIFNHPALIPKDL